VIAGMALAAAAWVASPAAMAQNILEEWNSIKPPPPPEIKQVTVDVKKTALFSLDFNSRNCIPQQRARCATAIPRVQKLMAEARAKGVYVAHAYTSSMKESDIVKDVAPIAGEFVTQSRTDKFAGSDLDKILKDKGIDTLILVGTSANGAVMNTATFAMLRGFKVIVPIDTMPADTAYQEQFAIWQIANGPGMRESATLTRTDMIKF
jgi:nicotinamidase-related amidase